MDENFQMLYTEALAAGKENIYDFRVMIVGHQGVGKTSLAKRLLGKQVKENETEPTDGIDIDTRCCQIDHKTKEWTMTVKTEQLYCPELRIKRILSKHEQPPNNTDVTAAMITDRMTESKPSHRDAKEVLDADRQSIIYKRTLIQRDIPGHITEDNGDVPISHFSDEEQAVKIQNKLEGRTFP
ncbi:hypothetical protein CHS0354_033060 [Potamilus streckersoni]|uniref:Uncharacterized protein n=1 Tax=Potamilus streckersoni TaxID=2493646 RepID=A0AAE0SQE7_9BIVA|nr:hypothetical protein CHS0354_033060 [Potamilus streckersoni]